MKVFPFKNRRVQATFPDHFHLTYERNGYIEATLEPDDPVVLRLSLHPSNDMRRPPGFGIAVVSEQAAASGAALEHAGPSAYFFDGQDDQFAADDVILRRWKAGIQSWVIGVSMTILRSRETHPAVQAVEAEIPNILASLEELPKPSLWQRITDRFS